MHKIVMPEMAILSLNFLNIFYLASLYWIARFNIKSSETTNKIQANYQQ